MGVPEDETGVVTGDLVRVGFDLRPRRTKCRDVPRTVCHRDVDAHSLLVCATLPTAQVSASVSPGKGRSDTRPCAHRTPVAEWPEAVPGPECELHE